MSTILHPNSHACHNESLRYLHAVDLATWEKEHHWSQFENLTLAAQYHLLLYEEADCRRQEAMRLANAALAREEMPL